MASFGALQLNTRRSVQRMEADPSASETPLAAPFKAAARTAVTYTRGKLPHGPGNILRAVRASRGLAWEAAIAARYVLSERALRAGFGGAGDKFTIELKRAVAAIIAGGGNCGEHAAVTFFELNRTLPPATPIAIVTADLDHAFVVIGDLNNLESTCVADAWSPVNTGKSSKSGWADVLLENKYVVTCSCLADGNDHVGDALRRIEVKAQEALREGSRKRARTEYFDQREASTLTKEELNEIIEVELKRAEEIANRNARPKKAKVDEDEAQPYKFFDDDPRIPGNWG
jgi:hypothetical protein